MNNFFVTSNCKKTIFKNSDKDKFLVGSVHNLQSNCNSDFQENVLQEYYKMAVILDLIPLINAGDL